VSGQIDRPSRLTSGETVPRYPLNSKLGGPKSQPGCGGKEMIN